MRGGKEEDVGEKEESDVDKEVVVGGVGGVELGGGTEEEEAGGSLEGGWGAGGTLTATGPPDSTASWSVVFLGFE